MPSTTASAAAAAAAAVGAAGVAATAATTASTSAPAAPLASTPMEEFYPSASAAPPSPPTTTSAPAYQNWLWGSGAAEEEPTAYPLPMSSVTSVALPPSLIMAGRERKSHAT